MSTYVIMEVEDLVNILYGKAASGYEDPAWCTCREIDREHCICERFGKDCAAVTCEECLRAWAAETGWELPSVWRYAQSTIFQPELPPDEQKVLCWTRTKKGMNNMIVGYYSPELGRWCLGANSNVIAWTQLPSDELLDEAYRYVMQNSEAGDV